jgi:hypothetical protein
MGAAVIRACVAREKKIGTVAGDGIFKRHEVRARGKLRRMSRFRAANRRRTMLSDPTAAQALLALLPLLIRR